jgi:hypothetical protein
MSDLEYNVYLLWTLFEYTDGKLYWKIKPCKNIECGQEAGGLHSLGYHRIAYNKKRYRTHRLVWVYHNGKIPEGYTIDHIDRNKLNNKIENLRLATKSEQQWNSGTMKNSSTGIPGVSWSKTNKKWHAYINKKGNKRIDAFFNNFKDAVSWRKMMELQLHGMFAGSLV